MSQKKGVDCPIPRARPSPRVSGAGVAVSQTPDTAAPLGHRAIRRGATGEGTTTAPLGSGQGGTRGTGSSGTGTDGGTSTSTGGGGGGSAAEDAILGVVVAMLVVCTALAVGAAAWYQRASKARAETAGERHGALLGKVRRAASAPAN